MKSATPGGCARSLTLRVALAIVRGWTRAYTWAMPTVWAERRRAEIESDLWELEHDPDGARGLMPAAQVLGRLFAGVSDDVCWRLEHSAIENSLVFRRVVALAAVATVMLSVLQISPATAGGVADRHRRSPIVECANAATIPKSIAEFRFQVFRCVGAFFDAPPRGRTTRAGD